MVRVLRPLIASNSVSILKRNRTKRRGAMEISKASVCHKLIGYMVGGSSVLISECLR